MNEAEQKAILTVCLMAAFADGASEERERAQIRRICENLAPGSALDLVALCQDVLLKRVTLDGAMAPLTTPESRQLAYEMAVCVCDSDGAQGVEEAAFLETLRGALGVTPKAAQAFAQDAATLADTPLDSPAPAPAAGAAELDKLVLDYAILNGALELLPQSLASMAILPLQMKMVYRIGKAHGYELDRGHIKDFAATLGVGLTGQYVEQLGRKLLGGLLRKVGGGLVGGIGGAATGTAVTFATTYALGKVAIQYYAGGRKISMAQLRQIFADMLAQGKSLGPGYAGEMRKKSETLDPAGIAALVRGQ